MLIHAMRVSPARGRARAAAVLAASAAAFAASGALAQGLLVHLGPGQTIAGDPPGVSNPTPFLPSMTPENRVGMRVGLTSGATAVTMGAPGQPEILWRTGDPTPGGPVFVAQSQQQPRYGNGNLFGFLAANGADSWLWRSDGVALATTNEPAPGTDTTYFTFTTTSAHTRLWSMSRTGAAAFSAGLNGVSGDEGVFATAGAGGEVSLLARFGQPVPGVEGANYTRLYSPSVAASGAVAFTANYNGGRAVMVSPGGSAGGLVPVVRTGMAAPGVPGMQFQVIEMQAFNSETDTRPALNSAGDVAWRGLLIGEGLNSFEDSGIWATSAGTPRLVVREGSQMPGRPAGVRFGNLHVTEMMPVITQNGTVAFTSSAYGTSSNNVESVWLSHADGTLQMAAGPGPSEALPEGWSIFSILSKTLCANDAGQLAFFAQLRNQQNQIFTAVMGWDENTGLKLIAKTGDLLEVSPGQSLTITALTGSGSSAAFPSLPGASGGDDGRLSMLSGDGRVVFLATAGSQNYAVVGVVPGPASAAAISIFLVYFANRRVRRVAS